MTTTESPLIHPTGHITFSRKVKIRDYESAEASIFVQFDIPTDGTAEEQRNQLISNAKAAFFAGKALVFEELGLEFSVSDTGVIHEVLQKTFGNVTEVTPAVAAAPAMIPQAAPQIAAAPAADGTVGPNPPYAADTQDKNERIANKQWAMARIQSNPDEWWDNRQNKRNPKAPDFKHKQNGMGVWL